MTKKWDSHAPDLVRDNKLMHERLAEQDRAIEQLHAAVKTAQELAARRLMEIERLRKDLRECRSHLTDVIASQDRPAIKAAADWLSDWEGTRIDPGSAPEPSEQLPAELAWGLESKLPGGDWKVYWALYSDRDRAEQAAKNGRPEGTEWRVVTYARMPDGASGDASSDVHSQLHKCEHCGATTSIDCVSDFQLIQYICGMCGKETRAHEMRTDV